MTTCKYCDSMNVRWKNIAKNGDPEKWELWTVEGGVFMWKHDCGFKGLSNCKYCHETIRWKEFFDTVKGTHFKPYHKHKDEEHACKWSRIKNLPLDERPRNWR